MNDILDLLCKEIAKRARDARGARLLIPGLMAELKEALLNTDWEMYFEEEVRDHQPSSLIEVRKQLAAITQALSAETPKPAKKPAKKAVPKDLPPGTIYAREFYDKYQVSYNDFRRHTEHDGINGDLLDVIIRVPYPETRPNYKDRYLTPDLQRKALVYWDEHGVEYTVPDQKE